MACMDREPAPVCPVPTEINQTSASVGGFEGVDMLVMVDNSGSMAPEQRILATAFFPLINSPGNPLPGWEFEPADNVRVAGGSSDMGLAWGGNCYTHPNDGWPGSGPPQGCTAPCGDNGVFKTYGAGKTVTIQHNVIPCAEGGGQCPAGWACSATGEGNIGACQAPNGDGTNQSCPALNANFAETPLNWNTPEAEHNPHLAFQVACLSNLGTSGCGFEQQLQSVAVALSRGDQQHFLREEALLAVIMVTDEEDCSIKDKGLFQLPEIQQDQTKVNIACNVQDGREELYLYSPQHYRDVYQGAAGGAGKVVFAAIVGVPPDGAACQGKGNEIGQCLDHPSMQMNPYQEPAKNNTWFFVPACERSEGTELVTWAVPGRRFVKTAQLFDHMGYVYSICNADWSPAMRDIAKLIAEQMAGTCYPKPLDWDPSTKQAKCDVVVEFIAENQDAAKCPSIFKVDNPVIEESVASENVTKYRVFCPLPRIAAEKSCADNDFQSGALKNDFGWYYCENIEGLAAENFDEICNDGLDNDGNGLTDCDDPACHPCPSCGGNGIGCEKNCLYKVELTEVAKNEVRGLNLMVQCMQQFSFTDPNCQENSYAACNDGEDNDGNGIWDCDNEFGGDRPHYADFNCCPMTVDSDNRCKVVTHDYCDGSSDSNPSDACREHVNLLGCIPPWDASN